MPDEINTNPVSAESEEAQEDINALRQIRLDKLNELCAAGGGSVQDNNSGSVRPCTGDS